MCFANMCVSKTLRHTIDGKFALIACRVWGRGGSIEKVVEMDAEKRRVEIMRGIYIARSQGNL